MATVRERTFTTKKDEQRRFLADYRDHAGARRFKTFTTEAAAQAFLESIKNEEHHVADSKSKSVAATAAAWLKFCESGDPTGEHGPVEPSTLREYQRYVVYATDPAIGIGRVKLTKLTAADVDGFLDRLRQRGHSAAIARKVWSALSTMLNFAQDRRRGWVTRNVLAEGPRRKRSRRDHHEVVIPTKGELRSMLDAKESPLWFRTFLAMAIMTGMRASELRGLTWQHVDLQAGIIRVRQRADFAGRIGPPKSKKGNRDIPMAPTVRRLLKELRRNAKRPIDGFVFTSECNRPLYHTNIVVRHFEPLQRRLGIVDGPLLHRDGTPVLGDAEGRPARSERNNDGKLVRGTGEPLKAARYGLHSLRHAAASLFIEQGWTAKKVQTVIGHSSIRMTFDRYGHLFVDGEDDQAAMGRLEASLKA
jgi:integrase